jgi:hypothetical protein
VPELFAHPPFEVLPLPICFKIQFVAVFNLSGDALDAYASILRLFGQYLPNVDLKGPAVYGVKLVIHFRLIAPLRSRPSVERQRIAPPPLPHVATISVL